MKINKHLVTKVSFVHQDYFWDLEHTQVRRFSACTKVLMPSVFRASTAEEVIRAGYQLTFGIKGLDSIKSITGQRDGSFLVENDYGTLRFTLTQEAPKPRVYTEEETEDWIGETYHDMGFCESF